MCVCEGGGGGVCKINIRAAKYGHSKRVLSPKNTTATHSGLPGFTSSSFSLHGGVAEIKFSGLVGKCLCCGLLLDLSQTVLSMEQRTRKWYIGATQSWTVSPNRELDPRPIQRDSNTNFLASSHTISSSAAIGSWLWFGPPDVIIWPLCFHVVCFSFL